MNKELFIKEVEKLGIEINSEKLEKLDLFYNLLIEWNEKINLTTIVEEEVVYLKHFYDSLTLYRDIDLSKSIKICDVGSGAGFPGIVLKIAFPNLKIKLIDSLQTSQKENNISAFKSHIESSDSKILENASDVIYNYSTTLNTYYEVKNSDGSVSYKKTYSNPTELITAIMTKGAMTPSFGNNMLNTVFTQMVGDDALIQSQYDLVYGNFPKNNNEVLILVDDNNCISDYTLYALGIRDLKEIIDYIKSIIATH